MAISQMSRIWYTTLTPPQKAVALALADWADDAGYCYPSLARIAEKVGYSRRQTQRIVHDLAELGYVEIAEEAKPNRTPTYRLHPAQLEPSRRTDVTKPPRRRDDNMSPPDDTDDTPRGDIDVTPEVTPMSPDTSRDTSSEDPSVDTRADLVVVDHVTDTFTADAVAMVDPDAPIAIAWSNQAYMDIMLEVFGEPTRQSDWSLYQQLINRVREANLPPAEILERAQRLAAQWGPGKLTPASLDRWWNRFGSPLGAATDTQLDDMRESMERRQREARLAQLDDDADTGPRPPDSVEQLEARELIASLNDRYGEDQ